MKVHFHSYLQLRKMKNGRNAGKLKRDKTHCSIMLPNNLYNYLYIGVYYTI